MTNQITSLDLFNQLKADLIGKDSYRGVTLTYTWLANQFGHISLGFIPTFMLFISMSNRWGNHAAASLSPIIISIGWLLFEIYNFLGPLVFFKRQSGLSMANGKAYIFQPAWRNVAFDTITDILFFWFGAFLASAFCSFTVAALSILLVLAGLLIYPSYYWYLTKMYLQKAQYPFQFRLSQWDDTPIDKKDVDTIYQFLNNRGEGMHLFVFGSKNIDKTSIGVGIATELSIKHHPCVYTTAMKLSSMFFESEENQATFKNSLWTWRTSSILVIDDINPGDPIKSDIIPPERFLNYLDTFSRNDTNRKLVRDMNVIWVLGNDDSENEVLIKWQQMLEEIGVEKAKILSINLQGMRAAS